MLDEIKAITDGNLKEPSTLYDLKEKGLERIHLALSNQMKFHIGALKFLIKKENVQNIPKSNVRDDILKEKEEEK